MNETTHRCPSTKRFARAVFQAFFSREFLEMLSFFQPNLGDDALELPLGPVVAAPSTMGYFWHIGRPSSAVFSMSLEIMSFGSTPPRRSMGWVGGKRRSRHICHPQETAIDESQFLTKKVCFFWNSTCLRK